MNTAGFSSILLYSVDSLFIHISSSQPCTFSKHTKLFFIMQFFSSNFSSFLICFSFVCVYCISLQNRAFVFKSTPKKKLYPWNFIERENEYSRFALIISPSYRFSFSRFCFFQFEFVCVYSVMKASHFIRELKCLFFKR